MGRADLCTKKGRRGIVDCIEPGIPPTHHGFFIPGGQAYGYEAGPDGVELLECNASRFNLKFTPKASQRWEQAVQTYLDRATIWEEEIVPPSER